MKNNLIFNVYLVPKKNFQITTNFVIPNQIITIIHIVLQII
jgi:hypothetical protein